MQESFAALRISTPRSARMIELTAHAYQLRARAARPGPEPAGAGWSAPLPLRISNEELCAAARARVVPGPRTVPAGRTRARRAPPRRMTAVQVNGEVQFHPRVSLTSAGRDDIAELLASHPAYPRDDVARLVIVPGKIASIVLR